MTTIYHYDADTKEYLGQSDAARDPLERKPLIPAVATTKKPPAPGAHQAAVFDPEKQTWGTVPDYRGVTFWLADGSRHTIDRLDVTPPDDALSAPPPLTPAEKEKNRRAQPATVADLEGKVSKSGDTITGDLQLNSNSSSVTTDSWNTTSKIYFGLPVRNGHTEIGFHEKVNKFVGFYIKTHWNEETNKVWEFKNNGHIYGPNGRYITEKEAKDFYPKGLFEVGSYLVCMNNGDYVIGHGDIIGAAQIKIGPIEANNWQGGKGVPYGTWRLLSGPVKSGTSGEYSDSGLFQRIA